MIEMIFWGHLKEAEKVVEMVPEHHALRARKAVALGEEGE